jgi:hypothetical protein
MREGNVKGFDMVLCQCSRLGTMGGAGEAVAVTRAVGGEFIHPNLQPDPDPLRYADAKGNLMVGAYFRHPALRADRCSLADFHRLGLPPDTPPWAKFAFLQKSRSVIVGQDASLDDQRLVDPLALGQLLLASQLCPLLEPAYGWIDERGANLPYEREITPATLRYLFWANIFGPEYVRFLGKDFLAEAPGWYLVDLPNGGMLYVVSESYLEWWHTDRHDVLDYFRQRVPHIQLYRAEEWDW